MYSETHYAEPYYADSNALLTYLSSCLTRPVVFLAGSALTMPAAQQPTTEVPDGPARPGRKIPESFMPGGVPGTGEIIGRIHEHLKNDPNHVADESGLESLGGASAETKYQEAFHAMLSRCGPDETRQFLCEVVLDAYFGEGKPAKRLKGPQGAPVPCWSSVAAFDEDSYRALEENVSSWRLPPGAIALGEIIAEFQDCFGKYLLTTNFDPLLAVAIRRARGRVVQSTLYSDSNPALTLANGCHLVHLHGYWYRDALHTPEQLKSQRTNLSEFLKSIIRRYTVVVMGYGGWDDQVLARLRLRPTRHGRPRLSDGSLSFR